MTTTNTSAVPFAQGQDVVRLRAAVNKASHDIKDYTKEYEDPRAIVEALSTAEQAEPGNKALIDILLMREKKLEAAHTRETTTLALISNCLIAESSAVQAQAVATAAMALPAATTTTPLTTTPAEKKIIKRKLPEPRDG